MSATDEARRFMDFHRRQLRRNSEAWDCLTGTKATVKIWFLLISEHFLRNTDKQRFGFEIENDCSKHMQRVLQARRNVSQYSLLKAYPEPYVYQHISVALSY